MLGEISPNPRHQEEDRPPISAGGSRHSSRHSRRSRSPIRSAVSRHRSASSSTSSSSPRSRREQGIFDTQIRPKDPPTFAGKTHEDPEVWAGAVSNFFRLIGGPAHKQVAYASTLLHGSAQTWWQRKLRAGEAPEDWQTMQAQLLGRFQNTNKADAAMAALVNIRQQKEESTHDFICRFEAELDKVETYDEQWLLKMFIWGLPQDQAVLVSQKRPRTLSHAFQLARDAALAAQMARRPGGGKQENSGKKEPSQGQQPGRGGRGTGGVSKTPNTTFFAPPQNFRGGYGRGRGQAGRQPVPPQAPVLVVQSNQRQPGGSGQRGRGRGNQKRPRVAVMVAQDDEGTAGSSSQDAAQHAAGSGTDASLHQGQGN